MPRRLVILAFTSLMIPTGLSTLAAQTHMRGQGGMMHMSDMRTIRELVLNHESITRTIEDLPNGVRTLTESADTMVARLIQEHMTSMEQRVRNDDQFCAHMQSEALTAIYRLQKDIRIDVKPTPRGVQVTQTSNNPQAVQALQQHAQEVSALVKGGPDVLRASMMKRHGAAGGGCRMM